METFIKDIDKTQKEIKASVSSQDFEKFVQKAVDVLGKDVELKGFRKGQAPKKMTAQAVGQGKILQEAANMAIKECYPQIVKENNLQVLGNPEIEILKLAPGNPLEFKAKVSILPKIKLPDYKKIVSQSKRKEIKVEDKEVEELFQQLQETKDKIPEEQKKLINFEKPEELKQTLRTEITREKEAIEKQRLRNEILKSISKDCDLKLPEVLILAEKQRVIEDLKRNVDQALKIPFDDYLKKIKKTEKELEESLERDISQRFKKIFILLEIQKQEKIEASEDELEREVRAFLEHPANQKNKESIDQRALKSYLKERIEQEKTLQLLEQLTQ